MPISTGTNQVHLCCEIKNLHHDCLNLFQELIAYLNKELNNVNKKYNTKKNYMILYQLIGYIIFNLFTTDQVVKYLTLNVRWISLLYNIENSIPEECLLELS